MYTLLIILGIYLISVLTTHFFLYIDWIKEDPLGHTIGDFYSFHNKNYSGIFFLVWCPTVNTIVLLIEIIARIGRLFSNIEIK